MPHVWLKPQGAPEAIEVDVRRVGEGRPDGFLFRWGEAQAEVEVRNRSPGEGFLHVHGEIIPFYSVQAGRHIHVWVRGRTWSFDIVDRLARRPGVGAAAAAQEELTAPMPGTVLHVQVCPGDRFTAHQPLVILESMKMEMTLSVPHAGRVVEVACREGQLVAMGAVLLKLEGPTDETDAP